MKRNLALLLTSVLLVFALTACGGDKKDNGVNDAVPPVNDNADNGANNGENGGVAGQDGAPNDSGAGDVIPGDDGGMGDQPGGLDENVTKQNGRVGVSYGQMLRNGRVHDTDGILTDGENAFMNGTSY